MIRKAFSSLWKRFRALWILLLLLFLSISFAKLMLIPTFEPNWPNRMNSPLIEGFQIAFSTYGFIIIYFLTINSWYEEIQTKRIHMLIPRLSRGKILMGTYIGNLLFWVIIVGITILILMLVDLSWNIKGMYHILSQIFLFTSIPLLFSTFIRKRFSLLFLGVLISLIAGVLQFRLLFVSLEPWVIPTIFFVWGACFITVSIILFQRKDL